MAAYTLTGKKFRVAIRYMRDNAKLFDGLTPVAMARLARSMNLGKFVPTSKEGMALLVYVIRMVKHNPALDEMIKEVRSDADGKVSIIMNNVEQSDLDKQKRIVMPGDVQGTGNSGLIKPGDAMAIDQLRKISEGIRRDKEGGKG